MKTVFLLGLLALIPLSSEAMSKHTEMQALNCMNMAFCQGGNGPGQPCYSGPGGAFYSGPGGACYAGPGGPLYAGPGGDLYDGPGGNCYAGPGGACHPKFDGSNLFGDECPSVCVMKFMLKQMQ